MSVEKTPTLRTRTGGRPGQGVEETRTERGIHPLVAPDRDERSVHAPDIERNGPERLDRIEHHVNPPGARFRRDGLDIHKSPRRPTHGRQRDHPRSVVDRRDDVVDVKGALAARDLADVELLAPAAHEPREGHREVVEFAREDVVPASSGSTSAAI
jgi:hypothetical protein